MNENKKELKKNLIEQAIGQRVEKKEPPQNKKQEYLQMKSTETEMMDLESLQMKTTERLQDPVEDVRPMPLPILGPPPHPTTNIPVPKSEDPSVTSISSLESLRDQEGSDPSAEDKKLSALKAHIASQGVNVATVGAHINILCSQPMVIPSITTWDMKKWQRIPTMVYKILVEPGFLDTIWPALRLVLGTNVGNVIWATGISITFAFFGVIQTLPFILEMEKAGNERD